MSTVRRVPFVGRSRVLGVLEEELTEAARGHLGVVLVHGEPGVGKSRLADELLRVHPEVTALSGRAYSLASNESLGLWVDTIETHLRGLSPDAIEELCGPRQADLAALLPSVAALGETTRNPPRSQLLDGLAALMTNISRRGPVVVVLDDVHLADGTSWAALGYLVRHLANAPILIVLGARTVELSQEAMASDVLLSLEQEGFLRRVLIGSFDRQELEEFAAVVADRSVDDRLVTWLMERSGGTPLFAFGLLRALLDEGGDLSDPVLPSLPKDLKTRVESRLRELDANDRATLELLAVVGGRVDIDDLTVMTHGSPEELLATLERLLRVRLLAEFQLGAVLSYEIYHPLVQEAIYASLTAARRRALHRFVARNLLASGRLGSAAGHFVRSASPGDDEAIEALTGAFGQADARELHREALTLLDALLDILPAGDTRWLDVYDAMNSQAEWVVDHRADMGFGTGLRAMRRIDQLLRSGPPTNRQAAAKFRLGTFVAWGSDDAAAGRALIVEAQAMFAATGQHRAALLADNELGYVDAIAGDSDALLRRSRDVLALADLAGDRFAQMQALCAQAHALLWGGRVQEAPAVLTWALRLARQESRMYRISYLLGQHAYERALSGDMPAAHAFLTEGREANAAHRDTYLPDYACFTEWLCGRLTVGLANGREMLAWDGGGFSRRRAFGACFAGFCAIEIGAIDEATRMARASKASFGSLNWWCQSAMPAWMEAALCAAAGDHDGALELLVPTAAYMDEIGTRLWPAFIMFDIAESAVRAGRPDTLAAAIASTEWIACPPAAPGQAALERFCIGALALAQGCPEDAVADLASAVEVFDGA